MATKLDIKAPPIEQGTKFTVGHSLPLESIRTDGGTQARAGLDDATVREYAETWLNLSHKQNGFLEMPPIVVFHDGSSYWLADGFHRVAAYRQFLKSGSASASPRAIRAVIQQGTQRDAILYACGANDTHGLRRTQADKRRAIERLLNDDEWRQWSDSEIARRCNVSHPTVATVRKELYPENLQDSRTVERGGTTYQQKPPAKEAKQPYAMEQAFPLALRKRAESLGVEIASSFDITRQRAAVWIPGASSSRWMSVEDLTAWCAAQAKPKIPEVAAPFWQSLDSHHPTAHLWTRERPDLWRSACGMTRQNRAPNGSTEASHCSSCVRATWPQNQEVKPTRSEVATDDDHRARIAQIRNQADALGVHVIWEDDEVILHWPDEDIDQLLGMSYQDALDWLQTAGVQQAQQRLSEQEIARANDVAPDLAYLDATLPKALSDAGYFWQSAAPPIVAHNDGWRGDAPTVELALTLAKNRETAKAAAPKLRADWWNCGLELSAINTAIGQGDRLSAARAALHLAVVIIGDSLIDYGGHMSEAEYEALKLLVRHEKMTKD